MAQTTDYDALAASYDRRYQGGMSHAGVDETLLAFVGSAPGCRVLEVGCGTGHWLARLEAKGFEVTGLDASAEMLARARSRQLRGRLEHGRAEQLPFAAASFDRIVCINALHHFSDAATFFAEARRVVAPGGGLLTIGLDPHAGVDVWCIYDYFEGTLAHDLERYPPTAQIRAGLAAAGFVRCETQVAQHLQLTLPMDAALASGHLDKGSTSQLADLDDDTYARGIAAIRAANAAASARGEPFLLTGDLHVFGTTAWADAA